MYYLLHALDANSILRLHLRVAGCWWLSGQPQRQERESLGSAGIVIGSVQGPSDEFICQSLVLCTTVVFVDAVSPEKTGLIVSKPARNVLCSIVIGDFYAMLPGGQ